MSLYAEHKGAISKVERLESELAATKCTVKRTRLLAEIRDAKREVACLRADMIQEARMEEDDDGPYDARDDRVRDEPGQAWEPRR